jgi:hypothetical protein
MPKRVERRTVDLNAHPDLVVIYLGMRINRLSGLGRLVKLGPEIQHAVDARPDGLLLHEYVFWGAPAALRDASVLARLRVAGGVDADAATSALVARLSPRQRRHRLLA